ncbi:MAG: hypothetical protein C4542_08050 [Dehalococcoidia bacterium]|nr:MAG: hypothetical protein C4542_08050 [Dehalococcoidia bacterium]
MYILPNYSFTWLKKAWFGLGLVVYVCIFAVVAGVILAVEFKRYLIYVGAVIGLLLVIVLTSCTIKATILPAPIMAADTVVDTIYVFPHRAIDFINDMTTNRPKWQQYFSGYRITADDTLYVKFSYESMGEDALPEETQCWIWDKRWNAWHLKE